MPLNSMTGFASAAGKTDTLEWQWEARSVNARGLDLRVRLPEGLEAMEAKVRSAAQSAFKRGAIQVSLRVSQTESATGGEVNEAALARALDMARQVSISAQNAGLDLAPMRASDLLAMRGVVDANRSSDKVGAAAPAIEEGLGALFTSLAGSRKDEGLALHDVLVGKIDQVEDLVARAAEAAGRRAAAQPDLLKGRVEALLDAQDRVDEARLAQELALMAVKADVTEELDRLRTHVDAARALLTSSEPAGRKLDFLMQEFNREANTLCSKSQDTALTAIGLELKVVIDQMREQCQNVE